MCEAMERIKAEGIVEGVERGKAEGIAEGKREGKREGRREGRRENMFATAKRLLANGKLMLKEIAECTGLSLAQVKKLQPTVA